MSLNRTLHIIMPMAGEGSRFSQAGWTTPKPLIEYKRKPLFQHAVESISIENCTMKYSFIVREEHIGVFKIDERIRHLYPQASVFAVQHTTRGAVETCMFAKNNIGAEEGILILDCDLAFTSTSFNTLITKSLSVSATLSDGGALVSFHSDNPRYSYAQVDTSMRVVRTAEKEVISSHALCGAYYFGVGGQFLDLASDLIKKKNVGAKELYVSLLYNQLIALGGIVRLAQTDTYHSYGTPQELQQYL